MTPKAIGETQFCTSCAESCAWTGQDGERPVFLFILITVLCGVGGTRIHTYVYSHAPHNNVLVNKRLHIGRWSHKITIPCFYCAFSVFRYVWIPKYHCVAVAYCFQYSNVGQVLQPGSSGLYGTVVVEWAVPSTCV